MAKAKQQEQSDEETQPEGGPSTRPVAKFSGSGGIHIAVWKNKSDEGRDHYSVRLERVYKDGDDYQTTPYLREGDLLRAQKLLGQADDWIEQDKAKHRSQGGGRDQGAGR